MERKDDIVWWHHLVFQKKGSWRGFKEVYLSVKRKIIYTKVFVEPNFSCVQATRGKVMSVGWLVDWSVRLSACNAYVFKPINHEWMIGSWWNLHVWKILKIWSSWHKVKVTKSKSRSNMKNVKNLCICLCWKYIQHRWQEQK